MEKEESRPASHLSAEQAENILKNWTATDDTCQDEPQPLVLVWPCDLAECKDLFGESMFVSKTRDLPIAYEVKAVTYIETIVKRYPFQLRSEMARPMWHRFLDVWNDTGKLHLAMRVI